MGFVNAGGPVAPCSVRHSDGHYRVSSIEQTAVRWPRRGPRWQMFTASSNGSAPRNIYMNLMLGSVVEASAMATDMTSTMDNSGRSTASGRTQDSGNQDFRAKANEAMSKVADVAQQASAQAKQQASSLAADAK